MMLVGAGLASGLMVGQAPMLRQMAVRMDALNDLSSLKGPEIPWGPEGVAYGYTEADIKGNEGFNRFIIACKEFGVVPPPGSTILAPSDSAFDRAQAAGIRVNADILKYHIIPDGAKPLDALTTDQPTLHGETLVASRRFRKNYLDNAIVGLVAEGAGQKTQWPNNVQTSDGCMIHAVDTILVPSGPAKAQLDTRAPPARQPVAQQVEQYQEAPQFELARQASRQPQQPPLRQPAPVGESRMNFAPAPTMATEQFERERSSPGATATMVPAPPPVRTAAPLPVRRSPTGYGRSSTYAAPTTSGPPPPSPKGDSTILVQGGSLRTWSYRSPSIEQVQVELTTEGRPLDADIELWHGPDNTPVKMRVYNENGQVRPFSAVIETPRGPNTVAIRNIGQLEFPFAADVIAHNVDQPSPECLTNQMIIQGGALRTYPFNPSVDSVQVLLKTDGRPLNARIELLQGPNNNKQVIELYTENGLERPFFCVLKTPGSGNVIRIVNTAPVEFPMTAAVLAHTINQDFSSNAVLGGDVVIGGDFLY